MDVLAAAFDAGGSGGGGTAGGGGGASSSSSSKRPVNAPAELLDYAAVDEMGDREEVRWVLGTLQRGVHGRYPEVREKEVGWEDG